MPKAKKLPSGKWRARQTWSDADGRHSKSFTADTKAEAERLAAQFTEGDIYIEEKSVKMVVEEYINLSEVLSPTTLSSYKKILANAFPILMEMQVSELTDSVVQNAINLECKRKNERTRKVISPKTVKNEWGLIASALKMVCNRSFNIKLPKVQRKNETLPDPSIIMSLIRGTKVELPCMLAMWMSLRLSEILGLNCSSIKDGVLYIDQVSVEVDGREIIKPIAKTSNSIRKLTIPSYILSLVEEQDTYKEYKRTGVDSPLVTLTRNQIYHLFVNEMHRNNLDLCFHDLRHFCASICLTRLSIPERVVMDIGGWSTPSVMKSVYSQSFNESRQEADKRISEYLESLL